MYTSQFSSINDVTFSSPVAGVFHVIRPQSFHVCLRRRHGAGECGREAPPGPQILVIKKIRSAVPSPGSPGSAAAPRPSPLIHHYINKTSSFTYLHTDSVHRHFRAKIRRMCFPELKLPFKLEMHFHKKMWSVIAHQCPLSVTAWIRHGNERSAQAINMLRSWHNYKRTRIYRRIETSLLLSSYYHTDTAAQHHFSISSAGTGLHM